MNLYHEYTKSIKEALHRLQKLNQYITNYFLDNNLGVAVEVDDFCCIIITCKLHRDKEFDPQIEKFNTVVLALCKDLDLKISYSESKTWDSHLNMPLFREEKVILVGE